MRRPSSFHLTLVTPSGKMPPAEKELVDRYLTRYKDGDLDGMYACLDSNFTFSDVAFPNLDGQFEQDIVEHAKSSLACPYSPPWEGYVCHVCQESSYQ
jgi:hypothetical protein